MFNMNKRKVVRRVFSHCQVWLWYQHLLVIRFTSYLTQSKRVRQ